MSKKQKKPKMPKVRHAWAINPKTRVKKSDKKYKRPRQKQNLRRELKDV